MFFCVEETEILNPHRFCKVVRHSRSKMHETCLVILNDPRHETRPRIELGTFGLVDKCSTTKQNPDATPDGLKK